MNLRMPDKMTLLCKELATQGTCVQILTSVESGVLNKISLVCKPFATHRAWKGPLPRVYADMFEQWPFLCKCLTANGTGKWTFSCVNTHVIHQCTPVSKTARANITWVWLLPGMYTQMSIQVTFLCKAASTHMAHMRFGTTVHFVMPHQMRTVKESLPTSITFVWSFSRMTPCVYYQVTLPTKLLTTYLTTMRTFTSMCLQVAR